MRSTISFVFLAIAAFSQAFSYNFEGFEDFIEKARQQRQIPGAAVCIVQDDKILFAKGFGTLRIGGKQSVDENTIFQIGSVTKTFTSAGIGLHVEKNVLQWDDEILLHLPSFALKEPYPSRYSSARDLLAHRTGLPPFGGDLLGKIGYSPDEILYRVRFIEPATSFRNRAYYSNVGYFIAGQLLAKLAKSSWEEYVRTALLVPLEMQRSGFSANLDSGNVAYAHAEIDGEIKLIPWDRTGGFPAAGAITSTAADMGNWMAMLVNGGQFRGKQILQKKTVDEMFLPSMVGEVSFSEAPPIAEDSGFSYGLGWNNYHYHGKMIVEKGGGLDGARSVIVLIPELRMGITVLSNLNLTMFPEAVRAKFLEICLGKSEVDLQAGIQEKEKQLANLLKKEPPPKNGGPLGHKLAQYTGIFESPLYGVFNITVKDRQLIVEAGPGKWRGTLTPWSNDTFLLEWPTVNSGNQQATFTFGPENTAIEMQTETLGNFTRRK